MYTKIKFVSIVITVIFTIIIGGAWSRALFSPKTDTNENRIVNQKPTATPTQALTSSPLSFLIESFPTGVVLTPILKPPLTQTTQINQQKTRVVRVIDGDTIEIEGGIKVRYLGIDTPETVHPEKSVQCFGIEASNKNKELVEGKVVSLEKDISETDKYGRLLRYVWLGDLLVNDYLVREGYAYSYTYPPDVKYQDRFLQAQQEARTNSRGLWGSCPINLTGLHEPSPPSPVINSANQQDGYDCAIKGNIASSGEKIYHLSGCGSYAQTKIDSARGERYFCSEADALAAGWRKAKNCP